jgi:fibronectin type 3 domain-containing protein
MASFINRLSLIGRLCFIIVAICYFPSHAMAGSGCSSRFSWLPYTDAVSYKIYYGQNQNGPYGNSISVVNPTLVSGRIYGEVTGLICGTTYYFVCTAVDNQGTESTYSTEVKVITAPDTLKAAN